MHNSTKASCHLMSIPSCISLGGKNDSIRGQECFPWGQIANPSYRELLIPQEGKEDWP